ncbi:MAG: Golgi apparatus membrane protein tvp23 [Vezdaea aestivalis]|nr:MAG: Golgi apparatus membrane protein tvp23 [Vezdaea aestivalis]
MDSSTREGDLSWRLSSHPITLITFLAFRISALLVYLLGLLFTPSFVLIFILTTLLLAADFYYLKNIAGRRLVGLRWWSEVSPLHGDTGAVATAQQNNSHWVFESAEPGSRVVNGTDKRFFWLALYVQPVLWVALAIAAAVRGRVLWLSLVGESPLAFRSSTDWVANGVNFVVIAVTLSVTNTLAFSRCDKFSQASTLASSALYSGGIARSVAGGMVSRLFGGR